MSSCVPESGYGLYNDFQDDDGFDFGDYTQSDFESVLSLPTKAPTSDNNNNTSTTAQGKFEDAQDEEPITDTLSIAISDSSTADEHKGFIIGSDSPPAPSESLETNPTLLDSPVVPVETPQTKYKESRFSPNLPHKPKRSRSRSSFAGDDVRSKVKSGCGLIDMDPQEQSRQLEQGEELRLAVTRGNVERVKDILDSGKYYNDLLQNGIFKCP